MICEDFANYAARKALRKLGVNEAPGKVFTFDGNTEGRIVIPLGSDYYCVKISDEVPDLHQISVVKMSDMAGNESLLDETINVIDVKAGDDSMFGAIGTAVLNRFETPYVVVITDTATSQIPETGLYVLYADSDGGGYISRIEFAETITPIDPKYLPSGGGGGLPVVEITSVKKTDGTTYALSETEAAAMEAAAETGLPICAKFNVSDGGEIALNFSAVLSYMSVPAIGTSAYAFAVDVETWSYYIAKEDGVWVATVIWSM